MRTIASRSTLIFSDLDRALMLSARILGCVGLIYLLTWTKVAIAQGAPTYSVASILYLRAHVSTGSPAPLPRRTADAIDLAIITQVGRAGTTVLRFEKKDVTACTIRDYYCIVSSSKRRFDALLDINVQKNDQSSYYVSIILIDRKYPDTAISEALPYFVDPDGPVSSKKIEEDLINKIAERVMTLLALRQKEN